MAGTQRREDVDHPVDKQAGHPKSRIYTLNTQKSKKHTEVTGSTSETSIREPQSPQSISRACKHKKEARCQTYVKSVKANFLV